jgi:hypothetical protein
MTLFQQYVGQEDMRNNTGRAKIILNNKFKTYYSKILSDECKI